MKTIKDKQILVGADFAGYPLKEAVVAHLKEYGWDFLRNRNGNSYCGKQVPGRTCRGG